MEKNNITIKFEDADFTRRLAEAVGQSVTAAVRESLNRTHNDVVLQIDGAAFARIAIDKINTQAKQAK